MGISERRARERTELRQDILEAARRIFAQEGFEALTMRRIAEEIEYSPTTIYLHFKDKSDLVAAICNEGFEALLNQIQELASQGLDPVAHLEAGLRAYVAFGLQYPSHYYVTFVVSAGREPYDYQDSTGRQAYDALRSGVAACIDGGHIRPADVDATAQALWAGVHGLVMLLITDKSFPFVPQTELVDTLIRNLVAGLGVRDEEPAAASR